LGFNEEIIDRRDKIVFHSLRHTFCSWLANGGCDLYVIQKLAGHKTLSVTERYSHLSNGKLQNAIKSLQDNFQKAQLSEGRTPKNSEEKPTRFHLSPI
jgi:integrase